MPSGDASVVPIPSHNTSVIPCVGYFHRGIDGCIQHDIVEGRDFSDAIVTWMQISRNTSMTLYIIPCTSFEYAACF